MTKSNPQENFRKKTIIMSDSVKRKLHKRNIYLEDLERIRDKGRVIKRQGRYLELHLGSKRKPLVGIFWELEKVLETRTSYRVRARE